MQVIKDIVEMPLLVLDVELGGLDVTMVVVLIPCPRPMLV
jgi:hypothetical protein